jgi:hypothetical protein
LRQQPLLPHGALSQRRSQRRVARSLRAALANSATSSDIHYILDSQARTIDALPGLYGPKAFLRGLSNAETVFKSLAPKSGDERNFTLSMYYGAQHSKISAAWTVDTQKIGGKAPEGFRVVKGNNGEALLISPLAVTKAITEANILRAMTTATDELGKITDEVAWRKIAELHSSDAVLDVRSISLIKHQNPNLTAPELAQLVQKFQDLIALDTVRNEYLMHTKLYTWLVKDPVYDDVEKLNEQVYAKLFLTPNSDPWLGLFSADVYTALDNGGVKKQ